MKAVVFEKQGLENLSVRDVEIPKVGPGTVLVRIRMAGVNPIDFKAVTSIPHVSPVPHIPGAEFAGEIEEVGSGVSGLAKGDRVTVYNRHFDGTCRMCRSGNQQLCVSGYIIGVGSNGGFAEYAVVDAKNAFRIPDGLGWEMAASLPVSALTAYHAIAESRLKAGETAVILGASGNTGLFALQFAHEIGSRTIGISRKNWIKEFGAEMVFDSASAVEKLKEFTGGEMADVVLNSLGEKFWDMGIKMLGYGGRMVGFGTLSGNMVGIDFNEMYSKQTRIIGSTGGTIDEFGELVSNAAAYKLRVWKKVGLEEVKSALESLESPEREGRLLVEMRN
ncbi:MAG: alcohol dehydrogenase catalytic domain-containing protein [Candidatus Marsarchaeota archaeon]|nr:alcohol dehydrogenase catalytic domain-containing protein [Candidatus Marsarchaeota archaeon]